MAILMLPIFCQVVYAEEQTPLYVYQEVNKPLPFDVPFYELGMVDSPESASRMFADVLNSLDENYRDDSHALAMLALFAEELIRNGGQDNPENVRNSILNVSSINGVHFLRELRLSSSITIDDFNEFDFSALELQEINARYLSIELPFASLRFDMRDAQRLDDVFIQEVGPHLNEEPSIISTMLRAMVRFLGVWVAFLIISLSIIIEPLRRKKATRWFVMSLCIVVYGANIVTAILIPVQENIYFADDGIKITLPENMVVILSLPIEGEGYENLVVMDTYGNPVFCKFNPISQNIEARITESGIYSLNLGAVHFVDIMDRSAEMQHAISVLTSRGLMDGGERQNFLPDREITRAEFLSTILRIMNLLDENAESRFPDVLSSDWFYSVAASASNEGLITGYADGTFRGNTPIRKIQMVSISANMLTRMMNYYPVDDIYEYLEVYYDGDRIANWARANVALATKVGIVPERTDGYFNPNSVMTRGDAAVMLYRLFNRIW